MSDPFVTPEIDPAGPADYPEIPADPTPDEAPQTSPTPGEDNSGRPHDVDGGGGGPGPGF